MSKKECPNCLGTKQSMVRKGRVQDCNVCDAEGTVSSLIYFTFVNGIVPIRSWEFNT